MVLTSNTLLIMLINVMNIVGIENNLQSSLNN